MWNFYAESLCVNMKVSITFWTRVSICIDPETNYGSRNGLIRKRDGPSWSLSLGDAGDWNDSVRWMISHTLTYRAKNLLGLMKYPTIFLS